MTTHIIKSNDLGNLCVVVENMLDQSDICLDCGRLLLATALMARLAVDRAHEDDDDPRESFQAMLTQMMHGGTNMLTDESLQKSDLDG